MRLPIHLKEETYRLWASGRTMAQIQRWLLTEHNLTISESALSAYVRKRRFPDSDGVLKNAVRVTRERISETSDIDRLDQLIVDLITLAADTKRALAKEEPKPYLSIVDRLLKALDRKLHYSGADSITTTTSVAASTDSLMRKLTDLMKTEVPTIAVQATPAMAELPAATEPAKDGLPN